MNDKCETCPRYREVVKDNNRAWQKVADLEIRLRDLESEYGRVSRELARKYE